MTDPMTSERKKAIEVLDRAIRLGLFAASQGGPMKRRYDQPGRVVESLTEEEREALKHLTAEDMARFRVEPGLLFNGLI